MRTRDRSLSPQTFALLVLLFLSILINYIDRGTLSLAAPLLKQELQLSASRLAILLGAFFWTYTVLMIVSGWIADRFDATWVLAGGFLLWSLATAATGLVGGFTGLLVCRMVLGAGESVAFPSYGRILAMNVGQSHRGFANAMISLGTGCGPALGTLVCGQLMAFYGWRPVFLVLGLITLLWLGPWIWLMPKGPANLSKEELIVTSAEIFRERSFWVSTAGHFCGNYNLYLMILWLPYYLVTERHLTMQQMAWEGAWFYLTLGVTAPVLGWIADSYIRAGSSPNKVRKFSMALGHLALAAGVFGCGVADPGTSFRFLLLMGVGFGLIGPNIFVFAQTLAGPAAAGRWTGWQNSLANLAGAVVAPVTGLVVDRTGHFGCAFVVAAVVAVVGGIFSTVLLGPLVEINWKATSKSQREMNLVSVKENA